MAQRLKPLTAMQETWVRSLGQEDPLEKEMAMHSSILAWRIPWTEGPGGLQSTGSQRVGLSNFTHSLTHLHRGRLSFFSASARTIPYTNRAPRIHPPTHAGHLEGAAQSTSVFCPCLGILSISPRPWLLLQEGNSALSQEGNSALSQEEKPWLPAVHLTLDTPHHPPPDL